MEKAEAQVGLGTRRSINSERGSVHLGSSIVALGLWLVSGTRPGHACNVNINRYIYIFFFNRDRCLHWHLCCQYSKELDVNNCNDVLVHKTRILTEVYLQLIGSPADVTSNPNKTMCSSPPGEGDALPGPPQRSEVHRGSL